MDFVFLITNLSINILCFIFGIIFLIYPIPKKKYLKNYRFSLKILSLAYFFMSFLNIYITFWEIDIISPEFIKFPNLLISSIQSAIFVFSLIILIRPPYSKNNNKLFITHSIVIGSFFSLYLILSLFYTEPNINSFSNLIIHFKHPLIFVRILFFIFYIYQIIKYIIVFNIELKKHISEIDNFFSENKLKLNWIKFAFYSATAIGFIAIIYQIVVIDIVYLIFDLLFIIFFFSFAIFYLSYNKFFDIIEPMIEIPNKNNEIKTKQSTWHLYKQRIIEQKIYLKVGITLEEMSKILNLGRTNLSNFINKEEAQNYNSWINQLRINDAKFLLKNSKNYSIADVAFQTGYSEQSNFSRQFKKITGETPSNWKKITIHN